MKTEKRERKKSSSSRERKSSFINHRRENFGGGREVFGAHIHQELKPRVSSSFLKARNLLLLRLFAFLYLLILNSFFILYSNRYLRINLHNHLLKFCISFSFTPVLSLKAVEAGWLLLIISISSLF